ncbi:Archaeal primase DnaG/twinkle, TOPRIM domain [Spirosomataceae bacterium]
MTITKDDLLLMVNSYDILNYYLSPYHKMEKIRQGVNFQNPLIDIEQDTPSFNIYCDLRDSHQWKFKDHATGDFGDCFELVMRLFNLSFPDAISKIQQDLCVDNAMQSNLPPKEFIKIQKDAISKEFEVKGKQFSIKELEFWNSYGIDSETLKEFNVISIEQYSSYSKKDNPYSIHSTDVEPIFGYSNLSWVKIYKPFSEKKYKFQFLGSKEPDFIFGWNQLPEKGDMVFLTGGEKDVLTLSAHGQNAITLNSESAHLSQKTLSDLHARFSKVIILYDNDKTGLAQSEKLSQLHTLPRVILPDMEQGGKDVSDYFKNNIKTAEEFMSMVDAKIIYPVQVEELEESPISYTSNITEMIEKLNYCPTIPFIWSGIRKGSFGFIFGPSKSGKTILCENLAFSIAAGKTSFLSIDIVTTGSKVLFISLEEFWQQRAERNRMQINNLDLRENFVTSNENLPRILASEKDWELLEDTIVNSQAEIVFIDSLSRLYSGKIEDSSTAKEISYKLREITNRHKITLIVIHHTPKQTGRPLTIDSLAGSRILAQEADFMLGVSKSPNGTRYLKEVAFRYYPENDEEVYTFTINENIWLDLTGSAPEYTLLKEDDGRRDESNLDQILDFFNNKSTDGVKLIPIKDLMGNFVDNKLMSKPTLYANLKKLIAQKKIKNDIKGIYELIH